jgi:hypothetical protein
MTKTCGDGLASHLDLDGAAKALSNIGLVHGPALSL